MHRERSEADLVRCGPIEGHVWFGHRGMGRWLPWLQLVLDKHIPIRGSPVKRNMRSRRGSNVLRAFWQLMLVECVAIGGRSI